MREALRLLESEKLVIATPNKGARVAPISLACLKDLYQTRKVIEVEALLLAAPNLDAASIGKLRALTSRLARPRNRTAAEGDSRASIAP